MCLKSPLPPPSEEPEQLPLFHQTTEDAFSMTDAIEPTGVVEHCPDLWLLCEETQSSLSCAVYSTRMCCYRNTGSRNMTFCHCHSGYDGEKCQYFSAVDESKSAGVSPDWLLIIIFSCIFFVLVVCLVVMFVLCRKRRNSGNRASNDSRETRPRPTTNDHKNHEPISTLLQSEG